jgi:alpha-beta hydrolase superfamily lysophospholipase
MSLNSSSPNTCPDPAPTIRSSFLHKSDTLLSFDQTPLVYQSWLPRTQAPQVIIAAIHGLGGHGGQWGNLVQAVVPQGYGVYALDQRGHGRSPGKRGCIRAWSDLRQDVARCLHRIRGQHPQVPLFLLGHSLGGAVVLDYGLRTGLDETLPQPHGIIATAPALGITGISPLRLALGRLLSRTWPSFTLASGMSHDLGTRDPVVNQSYGQDPLRHNRGSARLSTEFFATVKFLRQHLDQWHLPLLMLHGSGDRVTSPIVSRQLFDQIPWADKRYITYPGAYHEIHQDLDRHQLFKDITAWIQDH